MTPAGGNLQPTLGTDSETLVRHGLGGPQRGDQRKGMGIDWMKLGEASTQLVKRPVALACVRWDGDAIVPVVLEPAPAGHTPGPRLAKLAGEGNSSEAAIRVVGGTCPCRTVATPLGRRII